MDRHSENPPSPDGPWPRALAVAAAIALTSACGGQTTRTVASTPGPPVVSLVETCTRGYVAHGDYTPRLVWETRCEAAWQIDGRGAPVADRSYNDRNPPIAIAASGKHRSLARTSDGTTWWVVWYAPTADAIDAGLTLTTAGGPPDLEALGGLSRQAAALYASPHGAPPEAWTLIATEGDPATADALIATITLPSTDPRFDPLDAGWLRAARNLGPTDRARLIAALRANVLGPTDVPALTRLLGLDERGASEDAEVRAAVWRRAADLSPDDPLHARLLKSLLAGDGFGAQPEAAALACELANSGRPLPLGVTEGVLAAATHATTACPALDAAWFDATHTWPNDGRASCHDVSTLFLGDKACEAELAALPVQVPVRGGVSDIDASGAACGLLHPADVAWFFAAKLGWDPTRSPLDRATYAVVEGPTPCAKTPAGQPCACDVDRATLLDATCVAAGRSFQQPPGCLITIDPENRSLKVTADPATAP